MNARQLKIALAVAVRAAGAAGTLMRQNLHAAKLVNEATQFDIKLELDVRCQRTIEKTLRRTFPGIPLLGEEGDSGSVNGEYRWVVDPIDGTVNYAYGIPHACVSVALQRRAHDRKSAVRSGSRTKPHQSRIPAYDSMVGVVYDPFQQEWWTAVRGGPARLNRRVIHVSRARELNRCIVAMGFGKTKPSLERGLPYFARLSRRVRKVRMMGAAALALTYVATGRFDAYIERSVSLWDVAAGKLIVECAGGSFWSEPVPGRQKIRMIASNGFVQRKLPMPK